MRFLEIQPSPPLRPFIACLWILEGEGDLASQPQPVFPDGRAEFVVHYGEPFTRMTATGEVVQPRAFLVGQIERAVRLRAGREMGVIGARFRSAALGQTLGRSAAEMTGRFVDVSEFAGAIGRQLVDRVNAARSLGARVAAVEQFLLSWIRPDVLPDVRIAAAVNLMERARGNIRVDRVAREVALSPRQLQRLFVRSVGIRPKRFLRIIRFQCALNALQDGHQLTDTALLSGYHDHAHFTGEFHDMAGLPPSHFVRDPAPLSSQFISNVSDSYKT